MNIEQTFLQSAIKRFKFQKSLGEKTFEQLDDKDFLLKPSEESNSIAVIVQHLSGNMLSRWTNFSTEDGEKSWRNRDAEFEDILETKQQILDAWNKGWDCVLNTLENLNAKDVNKTITIRSEELSVVDAIIRQIDHYGYHIGQIVYLARMIKHSDWQTLSIPKNKSGEFNKSMNHK